MTDLYNWSRILKSYVGNSYFPGVAICISFLVSPVLAQDQLFSLDNTSIDENSAVGTPIGIISSSEDTQSYSFILPSGLNDNDSFSIDEEQLTSAAIFDYETKAAYLITIQAIDTLNQISAQDFPIIINNIGPSDLTLSKGSIDENLPPMSKVGSFSSEDAIGEVTFALVEGAGDTNNDLFTIVDKELEANIAFDYESQSSYNIRVQATDESNEFFVNSFSILINNLSEGPTDITLTNNTISENEPVGTLVGTLASTGGTGNVSFNLQAGQNDNDLFTLDGNNLKSNLVFNYESQSTYNITVEVVDEENNSFSKDFAIDILDLPGPSKINLSAASVDENQPVNTLISTLSAEGGTPPYTYQLVNGPGDEDNDLFIINQDQLLTNAVFDFETKNVFSIRIQVIVENEEKFSKPFSITVNDLEEGLTDISLSNNTIEENAEVNTPIGTFTATGAVGTIAYTLQTGQNDNELFSIGEGVLLSNATYDFETQDVYTISVTAQDDHGTFSKNFTINVTDAAEPIASFSIDNHEIPENQPSGTLIGNFSATGGTPPITFAFKAGDGDTDNGAFVITDGNQLKSIQGFDFEVKPTLNIRVSASDSNNEVLDQTFSIVVLDRGPTNISLSENKIEENLPAGSKVGELSTEGGASPYTYTFVQGTTYEYQLFNLASSTLTTSQPLDYENKTTHLIKINSEDAEGEEFAKEFTIEVIDEEELVAPIVTNPVSDFSVDEDADNATFDLNTVFSDADGDALSFSVNNNNTTLLTATVSGSTLTLDYLTNQFGQATLTLTASDGSESVQDEFTVTVNAVNDKPTTTGIANVGVQENNAPVIIDLYNAFADVEDSDDNLTYQVMSNSNPTLVSTAIIKPSLTLTFGSNQNGLANLTVRATDSGNEFVETSFSVNVTDVSNAPTVSNPISDFSVAEDAANSTIDLNTVFSDSDGDALTFSVDNDKTNIIAASISGAILTLDYLPNQFGQAKIKLTASDGSESVQDEFTVTVNAVNDKPTTTGIANVGVQENNAPVIIDLYNAFADVEDKDDKLTYGVVSNSAPTLVSTDINKSNLTLTFAPNQSGLANLTVRATDTENEFVETSFAVNVSDVSNTPTVSNPISNFSVDEDAANTTFDLNTVFSDADGDALSFSVNNNNTTLLTASVSASTLTLDYLPNQFGLATITLTASDGSESVQDEFIVTINAVNDKPTTTSIASVGVGENAPPYSIELSNSFADTEDSPTSLTYEAIGNTNSGLVATQIINTTLTLSFTPNLNGSSVITIKATDTGGESVETSFNVSVADVNNPPTFLITNTSVSSKEDAGPQEIKNFATSIKDGDDDSQQLKFNLTQTAFSGLIAFANAPSIDAITGHLTYTTKANAFGTADYAVTLSDNGPTGGSNNNTSAPQSFKIVVQPVGDPPSVPTNVEINENEMASGLLVSRNPVDGEEVTHYKITSILGGSLFQNDGTTIINDGSFITAAQGNAGLKFTPGGSFTENGSFNATASTTASDAGLGGTSTATLQIIPTPDKPVVTHAQTQEDTQTTSGLILERNENDGEEVTYFRISNITGGQLFRNDGTTPITNDEFIEYEAGKAGLKFTPSSNSTANGSFVVQAALGKFVLFISDTTNAIIKVISVNDAPVVTVPAAASVDEETEISLPGISVEDVDLGSANIAVKLSVENGILTLSQTDGLTFDEGGNAAASMGISGSITSVNNALNSLKYLGNTGFSGDETLNISVSDNGASGEGGAKSANATIAITVNPVNDAPVLENIEATSLSYTEDAPPVSVTQTITLADDDSETMLSASVKISDGYKNTEDKLVFPDTHPSLLGTFNTGTGELMLTRKSGGTDFSKSVFQNALREVKYQNTNLLIPSTTARTVTFMVTDAEGTPSAPVNRSINVISVNDPPQLSSIETDPLLFEPNTNPKITQSITIGDVDGGNIASASVKISQNYKQGEDVLDYTKISNITGRFFADRGELVLEGVDTPGNYVIALRSISYRNFAAFPSAGNRLVIFSVKDTDNSKSNELNRFIIIGDDDFPPSIFDFAKKGPEDQNIGFNKDDFIKAYLDDEGPDATPTEIRIKTVPKNGKLFLDGTEIPSSATTGDGFQIKISQVINLVYTPGSNFNGKDSFTWNATDGNSFAANDALVNITIDPINDKPSITTPTDIEINEDVVSKLGDIVIDDIDAGSGLVTVELSVDFGTLSMTQISGLIFKEGNGNLDSKMEFDGTISNVKLAINSLTYLSELNFTGNDKLKITVDDNGNTGAGNIEINSVALTIKVNPVNDPPIVSDIEMEDLNYTENDPPLQITSTLTINDVDDPDDAVTQAIITISEGYSNAGEELLSFTPSGGITGEQSENILTLTGTASLEAYLTVLKTLTYENKSNNPGNPPRTISIQLTDTKEGASNIVSRNINVTPVNDPPALTNIEIEALPYYDGQTSASITATLEVSDPDQDTLNQAIVKITENYQVGEDSLSITGLTHITAQWDKASGTLTLNGADTKEMYQEALRKVMYHKILSENNDPRKISFFVNDEIDTSNAAIRTVTILPNDPPSVSSFEKIFTEDEALPFALSNFSDHYEDDGIPSEAVGFLQILTLPSNGKLFFKEEEITQSKLDTTQVFIAAEEIDQLVYLPNPDFFGSDSFDWTASDGIKIASPGARIQLIVNPVNDPPVAGSFIKTGEEDSFIGFSPVDFKDNFTDADNDSLQKIIIRALPAQGRLKLKGFDVVLNSEISIGNVPNLIYEPAQNYNGEDSIRWSAADSLSVSSNSGLILMQLVPVNDAPLVRSFTKVSNENVVIPFTPADFTDHFSDIENDELQKVVITRLPLHGILNLNELSVNQNDTILSADLDQLKYTPNTEVVNGIDNFGWIASDVFLFSTNSASVNIIIGTGVTDFEAVTPEDSSFTFNGDPFIENFNHAGGELSAIRIDSLPNHGLLTLNNVNVTSGQVITKDDIQALMYVPEANFNGTDSLYWNARNGGDFTTANAKIIITVLPVNDAPTISEIEDQLILVNQTTAPISITVADVDSNPEDLLITVASGNANLVPNTDENLALITEETLQYNLTITPLADSAGTVVITLLASDGKLETQTSFTLNVVIDILTVDAGDDQSIKEGESVELTATTTGGDAPFTFNWTCDQAECAIDDNTQATVNVSPAQTTTYFVEVGESKGLVSYDTITVNVTPRPTALAIPSGFTPDGVEPNNLWIIDDIEFFENVVVEVFNRYGTNVFRSEGYQQPWDGSYKGDILPVGTYYYVVNIENGSKVYKGSVTILR